MLRRAGLLRSGNAHLLMVFMVLVCRAASFLDQVFDAVGSLFLSPLPFYPCGTLLDALEDTTPTTTVRWIRQ